MKIAIVLSLLVFAVGVSITASGEETLNYNRDIRPILSKNCLSCHGNDESHREADLRLDVREDAIDFGAIVPGEPEESELIVRVVSEDDDERMPPADHSPPLAKREITLLRQWITQGAEYEKYWSFVRPRSNKLPQVGNSDWCRNPIDYFILARLEKEGLTSSAQADRHTLIRRLSLDLTGLPPTPAEVEAFVNNNSTSAYEALVDRLLDSTAYGERWASLWLDLARYADTDGYAQDARRVIWPYRDWVIDALNADLPFDQFTTEQLAGDLLPAATPQQILATAFHRNTMTNSEGGTIDEEFRVAALQDRVDTTMQVWMGLTMGCARCHSHKYDPITQKEYYQFLAFFNQTEDADRNDNSPKLPVHSGSRLRQVRELEAQLAEVKNQQQPDSAEFLAAMRRWEQRFKKDPSLNWVTLDPQSIRSEGGATINRLEDGSLLVSGTNPAADVFELTAATDLNEITGLRIEALPHESLPSRGPGRTPHGNFVLGEVQMSIAPPGNARRRGRFVRIELPGTRRTIHIAELQVFSGAVNLARQAVADQSSTDFQGQALRGIDGNTSGVYSEASVTHTAIEDNPWFEVDLGKEQPIDRIVLWNRTDNGLHARLNGAKLMMLDANRKEVWSQEMEVAPIEKQVFNLSGLRTVSFSAATATFEQRDSSTNPYGGWKASAAIDGDRHGAKWGWAVAPHFGQAHTAVFETAGDVGLPAGKLLHIRLLQNYGQQHTLGRFRISVTDAPRPVRIVPPEIQEILAVAPDARDQRQRRAIRKHFAAIYRPPSTVTARIAELEKQIAAIPPVATPIMRELPPGRRRTTHVMIKGNYLNRGDEVEPGTPQAFHAFPAAARRDRLGLAQWLVDKDNPLTARVLINRYWAQLMGRGLVETEEDFGTMGHRPTHIELLDWLALHVQQEDWSLKTLLKTIVMSATYRQRSVIAEEMLAKDPRNLYFARGPRFRLSAEQLRDQALALAGILNRKMYGPSVNPPRPFDPLAAAFSGEVIKTSPGDAARRRGLYTFLRRTNPYPSMLTFDGTSREICTIRRVRTNTPLQALVTLNDPVFVEAAEGLARRIVREGGASEAERAAYGLRLVTARSPESREVERLVRLYRAEVAHYRDNPESARQMAEMYLGPAPQGIDLPELAAWTVVANVLLSLDEIMVKG